ncbi:hypothetical protein ACLOJK_019123 [Asimina triloba]
MPESGLQVGFRDLPAALPSMEGRRSLALGKTTATGRLGVCLRAVDPDLNSSARCHSLGWLRSSGRCVADGDLHCS